MRPDPVAVADLAPGLGPNPVVEPLHGDGSARTFYRIRGDDGGTAVLLVGPDPVENAATVRVSRHLASRGVRVPEVLGVDGGRGWILFEDLGDRSLYRALREPVADLAVLYGPVVDLLAALQVRGARGFRLATGFAPSSYAPAFMVEQEGLYFVREFCGSLLGLEIPAELTGELEAMARLGGGAPMYFLHRDFQSRNIHLTPTGPAAIDVQGARPGPLAYDGAALLLDPYTPFPPGAVDRLLERYRRAVRREGGDLAGFDRTWGPVGAFRLMQALGAFGKLGGRLGKPGFLEHAATALDRLERQMAVGGMPPLPRLRELVTRAIQVWSRHPARPDPGGHLAFGTQPTPQGDRATGTGVPAG